MKVVPIGFFLISMAVAVSAVAGEYKVSGQWPNGHGQDIEKMDPKEAPVCNALSKAIAALGDLGQPLRSCREPPLDGAGVRGAVWHTLQVDDPIALIQGLYRGKEHGFGRDAQYVDDPRWIAGMKELLEKREVRLETATVSDLIPNMPTTRLIRVVREGCNSPRDDQAFESALLAYADGDDLNKFHVFFLGNFESAFTFAGRTYLLGQTLRRFDDTLLRHLPGPQPVLYVYRTTGEHDVWRVCRLLYRQNKRR
jgi:hypothetical protein